MARRSKRQETMDRILQAAQAEVAVHGYPPTRRDLATACGLSLCTVQRYLEVLAAQGRIRMAPGIARGLTLPTPSREVESIKLRVGRSVDLEEGILARSDAL
ncbi:MAG: LexA family protein [Candidatus Dormibacteria bacterium]